MSANLPMTTKDKGRLLMQEFTDQTTLHGLPKVIRAQSACKRLVWSLLLVASLIALFYQASRLVDQFISFRKTVSVNIDHNAIDFPVVTICSESGIRSSVKEDIARHLENYNLLDLFNNPNYNFFTDLKIIRFNESGCDSTECNFRREYLKWFSNSIKTAALFSFQNYKIDSFTLAANMGLNLTTSVGLRIEDILFGCTYDGERCKNEDFVVIRHPRHLMCYSFKKGTETLAKIGRKQGLKLALKYAPLSRRYRGIAGLFGIQSSDVTPGYRVFVHPAGTPPYADGDGAVFFPGVQASIGFTKNIYERLGRPYGNCTSNATLKNHDVKYSSRGCLDEYRQQMTRRICNCTDISLPYRDSDLDRFPYCRILQLPDLCGHNASFWSKITFANYESLSLVPDICLRQTVRFFENMDCVANATAIAYRSVTERNADTHCYPPCSQIKYELRPSFNVWPSREGFYQTLGEMISVITNGDVYEMLAFMARWATDDQDSQVAFEEFKSSFLLVDVFLSDTDVTRNTEQVMYEWYQMLSEFGGLLGLYIGMSVMTFCEIIELLIMKIHICFSKYSKKVHPKSPKT